MSRLFDDNSQKIISEYMCLLPVLRMPVFYLLAKTHKSREVVNGSWASRPTLRSWFTSGPSTLLSVLGKILLPGDRTAHAFHTPLCDTLDLVHRLEALALKWHLFDRGKVTVSIYDFNNLYTNFLWTDAVRFSLLETDLEQWRFRGRVC